MRIIACICARGGSKGIPGKNIRPLCGKPLIVHTIETARRCQMIERVIVSTDSPEIAEIARKTQAEVPFLRPEELARDDTPKIPVIKHLINHLQNQEKYHPDIVVDLDPTSPLRTEKDIKACISMVAYEGAENVFSVTPARRNPYFNMVELVDGKVKLVKQLPTAVPSRQSAPTVYDMNASIYVWKTEVLMKTDTLFREKTRIYVMPEWAIDIDSETDFEMVEHIAKLREILICANA